MALSRGELLERLTTAPFTVIGRLGNASNTTMLVEFDNGGGRLHGVYKPRRGERPLWDFPGGTLWRRERAAYLVSEFLGWDIVPLTVLRSDAPLGEGSVQLFVPHDPRLHYFTLLGDVQLHPALARIAVFDLVVNNADRKASHVLLGEDGRLYAIDHGLTFHVQAKLRTVIWELGGTVVEPAWQRGLVRLGAALADEAHEVTVALHELLDPQEVAVLSHRACRLAELRALPVVDEQRRPYPWPPL